MPIAAAAPTATPPTGIPTVYAALYSSFTESWDGSTYVTYAPFTTTFITSYSNIFPIGSVCSAGFYGTETFVGPTNDNMSCHFDYAHDPMYVYHRGTQTYSKLPGCVAGTAPTVTGTGCTYTATITIGAFSITVPANVDKVSGACPATVNICSNP
jgi:hypothetical protein